MIQSRVFWQQEKHLRNIHPYNASVRMQDIVRLLNVDISIRIKLEWEVLPKRWIVERSLTWLNNSRRLSKDYEISVRPVQAVCMIAVFRTLLKRF